MDGQRLLVEYGARLTIGYRWSWLAINPTIKERGEKEGGNINDRENDVHSPHQHLMFLDLGKSPIKSQNSRLRTLSLPTCFSSFVPTTSTAPTSPHFYIPLISHPTLHTSFFLSFFLPFIYIYMAALFIHIHQNQMTAKTYNLNGQHIQKIKIELDCLFYQLPLCASFCARQQFRNTELIN